MSLLEASVAVLLRGRTGTGVGREEAAELARRFGEHLGYGHYGVAVKNGGEWFVVDGVNRCGGEAWSVAQVSDFLWRRERGLEARVTEPGFRLRSVQEEGS